MVGLKTDLVLNVFHYLYAYHFSEHLISLCNRSKEIKNIISLVSFSYIPKLEEALPSAALSFKSSAITSCCS